MDKNADVLRPAEKKISEAMKAVVARMFEAYIHEKNIQSTQNVDKLVESSTEELCFVGSAKNLALLEMNNPNEFERKILIKCRAEKNNRFKSNPEWKFHAIAVVADKDGNWYAFSPANIKEYGENYSAISTAGSLRELMKVVQEKEGGSWTLATGEEDRMQYFPGEPEFYLEYEYRFHDLSDNDLQVAANAYNDMIDASNPISTGHIHSVIDRIRDL